MTAYLFLLAAGAGESAEFFPLSFYASTLTSRDYLAVSEDGSVVVGDDSNDLVRWTRSTGPEVLLTGGQGYGLHAGISGDASIIVSSRPRPGAGREAIKLIEGDLDVLPSPAGFFDSRAYVISQDGSTIWGNGNPFDQRGGLLRWTESGVTQFPHTSSHFRVPHGVSANGGVLVGYSNNSSPQLLNRSAFRWTEQDGFQDLPGFGPEEEWTWAVGVSSDGRWAVGGGEPGGELERRTKYQGTRWDGMSPPERLLPTNEAWGTIGWDVTADGSVVVGRLYFSDEILDRRADIVAGIWTEETGRMVSLQDLLVSDYGLGANLAGYHLTGVYDVTDDGRFMVGHAINPAGLDEAWLVDLGPPLLLPGDYNNNGTVDTADYVVWRNGLGTTYTQADYDVWRANFGRTSASAVGAAVSSLSSTNSAVPEPTAACLVLIGLTLHQFVARGRTVIRCQHQSVCRRPRIQALAGLAE